MPSVFDQRLTRPEVEDLVMTIRATAQATIDRLRATATSEDAVRELRLGVDALTMIGRELLRLRPPVRRLRLSSTVEVKALAHRLYGDHSRSEELLTLNPGLARLVPMLPAGTEIVHYAW